MRSGTHAAKGMGCVELTGASHCPLSQRDAAKGRFQIQHVYLRITSFEHKDIYAYISDLTHTRAILGQAR